MSYLKDEKGRKEIIKALRKFLGDSAVVYIKIHGFHWNVVSPCFKQLHELLEGQYNDLWGSMDTIAERIRALGGKAPGSFKELLAAASIEETDAAPGAEQMLRQAQADYMTLIAHAHTVEKVADEYGDTFTYDMMTNRVGELEKMVWMTSAHLEKSH